MRWFKHISNARDDQIMSKLIHKFGIEGYGVWWVILEIIAGLIDDKNQCSASFSLKYWSNSSGISAKKFQKLARFLEENNCFSLKFDGDYLTIECPKLLKYKDEYTKKKNKNSENVRTKSVETPDKVHNKNTEYRIQSIDTDIKKEIQKKKSDDVAIAPPVRAEVWEVFNFWKEKFNHPRQSLNDQYKKIISVALKNLTLSDCLDAIEGCSLTPHNIGQNDTGQKWDGLHIIFDFKKGNPARFIGNKNNPPTSSRILAVGKYGNTTMTSADKVNDAIFGEKNDDQK